MIIYNCLVLEDNFGDQLAIEMILNQFPEISISFVNNSKSFLQELSKNKYDLYIVDIMLNETLTGIDLLHSISDPSAWVIISSSMESKDYYEEYKNLKFNKFFIKKPIDEFIFKTNIESFIFSRKNDKAEISENNFLMIKQGNYIYKVANEEIFFIETTDHATTVFTNQKKFTTYTPLKTFEELLKDKNFERANRNTLVNLKLVKRINFKENYIEIEGNQIPLSRNSKQIFLEKFEQKTF